MLTDIGEEEDFEENQYEHITTFNNEKIDEDDIVVSSKDNIDNKYMYTDFMDKDPPAQNFKSQLSKQGFG